MTQEDKKTAVWIRGSGVGGGYVEPQSLAEVAEILGSSVSEIVPLPYGPGGRGTMWMVKSVQLDRDAVGNRGATLIAARFNSIPVVIRGDVVCFPHGHPWDAPTEAQAQAPAEA